MGSELVSVGWLGVAVRGREGGPEGLGDGRGVEGKSGASVSRFASSSGASPRIVAFGSDSRGLPHLAQNRAVSDTGLPQEVQNMGKGFYHSSGCRNEQPFSTDFLHLYGGAVGQYFRHALHHLIRVVAHGQNAIGSMLRGVHE